MKFMKKQHFPRQTHFICLPLRSPAFRDKVTEFNGLLPPTLNPTIIRPTGSLHFTLGVLSLKTQDDIDKAVTFLQSCQAEVCSAVQGQKVTVALRGIDNMHKDVKRTSVIYAVPEEGDGRLRVLNLLQSKFKEASLLEGDRHAGQEVKLHCTLINTLHMKPRPKKRPDQKIDATELFETEQIKEFDFGLVEIEEVQICEMGVKEVDGEIRYKSVGGISLTSLIPETTRDVIAVPAESVENIGEVKDLEAAVGIESERS